MIFQFLTREFSVWKKYGEEFDDTDEFRIDDTNSKRLYIVRGMISYLEKDGIVGYGSADWWKGKGAGQ